MMQSKKSVKSEEKSWEEGTKEIQEKMQEASDAEAGDYVGLKETCPFQDQELYIEVHCRSNCAWYNDDACIVWDIVSLLRRIASQQETANTR